MADSPLVLHLLTRIRQMGLPEPELEYHFAAMAVGGMGKGLRKRLKDAGMQDWRFDGAYYSIRLAFEIDGGTWTGGRHVRGGGFESDMRKGNHAIRLGWRVLHFTGGMVESDEAVLFLERMLRTKG